MDLTNAWSAFGTVEHFRCSDDRDVHNVDLIGKRAKLENHWHAVHYASLHPSLAMTPSATPIEYGVGSRTWTIVRPGPQITHSRSQLSGLKS